MENIKPIVSKEDVSIESQEAEFKTRFKKKYPFAYSLIQSSGYDMAGWLFRNIKQLIL